MATTEPTATGWVLAVGWWVWSVVPWITTVLFGAIAWMYQRRNWRLQHANYQLAADKAAWEERMRGPRVTATLNFRKEGYARSLGLLIVGDGGDVHGMAAVLQWKKADGTPGLIAFEEYSKIPEPLKFGQSVKLHLDNEHPHTANLLSDVDPATVSIVIYSGARPILTLKDEQTATIIGDVSRVDMSMPARPKPVEGLPTSSWLTSYRGRY